jgi:type III restriction enzyme
MTQLVGRVLRQPDQSKTDFDELNESYVYCLRKKAATITKEVKKALESEGYEGDAASVVDRSGGATAPTRREAKRRPKFNEPYKPFEGKIYLPRFCVKKDQFYRITLEQDNLERVEERRAALLEDDDLIKAWLVVNLPFDHFSQKQLREVVARSMDRLLRRNADLAGKLALVKFVVREKLTGFVERETDKQTEAAFKDLFDSKKLSFFLECVECRFEIPEKIQVRAMRQLAHDSGDLVARSLFDLVPDDLNDYERAVALFLDEHPKVLWWYRNLVGPENFAIQGYRRHPIYPDFLVQEGQNSKPTARVLVLESKGKHLKGSEDTAYKRKVASFFEKAGRKVPWQKLGEDFENNQFRFQILDEGDYSDRDWRDDLKRLLDS